MFFFGCSPEIEPEIGAPHGAKIAQAVTDVLPFAPVRVAELGGLLETVREQRDAAPSGWTGGEGGGEQGCALEWTHDVLEER